MRTWSRCGVGIVAIAGLFALGVHAGAETCKLKVHRVVTPVRGRSEASRRDYRFRLTNSQSFFMQIGGPKGMVARARGTKTPDFAKVIKKEPAKYESKHPFRGVAKLGSQYFGFVFDAAPKKDAKEKGKQAGSAATERLAKLVRARQQRAGGKKLVEGVVYERLYFDVNHNGDLTDDKVIKAKPAQRYTTTYVNCSFPRVDLQIEVDGREFDYAFTMRVYSMTNRNFAYANASLNAAAYREGKIVLDGKKRRVVIVDFNSNGRFDDQTTINDKIRVADGTVYPSRGDTLYVLDPDAKSTRFSSPYDPSGNDDQHFVGRLVNVDGRFYELKVSPAGDSLTLNPSSVPTGYVTNPNKSYRAIVYGDRGFLKVVSDETGRAPLLVGEWKLASYTIDRTKSAQPDESPAETSSLLEALARALIGSPPTRQPRSTRRPRFTVVSARAKRDYPPVRVTQDKTVELPFGEPYHAVVVARYPRSKRTVSLSLLLVGNAGEICNNMLVNGRRPGKPKFTITTDGGKVVESGYFKYG